MSEYFRGGFFDSHSTGNASHITINPGRKCQRRAKQHVIKTEINTNGLNSPGHKQLLTHDSRSYNYN